MLLRTLTKDVLLMCVIRIVCYQYLNFRQNNDKPLGPITFLTEFNHSVWITLLLSSLHNLINEKIRRELKTTVNNTAIRSFIVAENEAMLPLIMKHVYCLTKETGQTT